MASDQEKQGKGNKPTTRSVESRVPRREKNDGKTKTTTKSTANPEKGTSHGFPALESRKAIQYV